MATRYDCKQQVQGVEERFASELQHLMRFVRKEVDKVRQEFEVILLRIRSDLVARVIRELKDAFCAAQAGNDVSLEAKIDIWKQRSRLVEENLKELWSYVKRDIRRTVRSLHSPNFVNAEVVRAKRFYRSSEFAECSVLVDADQGDKSTVGLTLSGSLSGGSVYHMAIRTMREQQPTSGYVGESTAPRASDIVSSVCYLDGDCVAALRLHSGTTWELGNMTEQKWCALGSNLVTFTHSQPSKSDDGKQQPEPDLRLVPVTKRGQQKSLWVVNFETGYASLYALQPGDCPSETRRVNLRGALESFCVSDATKFGLVTYRGALNSKSEILSSELKSAALLRKDRPLQYFRYSLIGQHRICLVEDSYYHLVDLFDVTGNKLRAICPQESCAWMHVETVLTGKLVVSSWALLEDKRRLTLLYRTASWYDEDRSNVSEIRYVTMKLKSAKTSRKALPLATECAQCFATLEPLETERKLFMNADEFSAARDRKRATQCYVNSIISHEDAWLAVDPLNGAVKQVERRAGGNAELVKTVFCAHETRDTVSGICKLNERTLLVIINCMKAQCVELDSQRTLDTIHFSQHHRFSVSQAFLCRAKEANTWFVFIGGSNVFFKLRVEMCSGGVSFATTKLRLANVIVRFAQDDSLHEQFAITEWCRETKHFQVYVLSNSLAVRRRLPAPKLKADVDWLPLRSALSQNLCVVHNWKEMTLYLYDSEHETVRCIESGIRVHAFILRRDAQNCMDIVSFGFVKKKHETVQSGMFIISSTSQSATESNNLNHHHCSQTARLNQHTLDFPRIVHA